MRQPPFRFQPFAAAHNITGIQQLTPWVHSGLSGTDNRGSAQGRPWQVLVLAGILINSSRLSSFTFSYKSAVYTYYTSKLDHGDHSEASGGIGKGVPGDGVIGAEPAKPVGAVPRDR